MKIGSSVAKHLREVCHGGNWTAVNLNKTLSDVDWRQAIQTHGENHSIATLLYHMGYYVTAVLNVLDGNPLDAKDELSFNGPTIDSANDWKILVTETFDNFESLACQLEQMPDDRFSEDFEGQGTFYRNVQGIVEHTHYHLGQMTLMKRLPVA